MSLNKLTDSSVEKKWMNINCNDIKCETLEVSGSIITGPFNISETTSSIITSFITNSSPMLLLSGATATNNFEHIGVTVSNASGTKIRISSKNAPDNNQYIISDNALNLITTAPSSIYLSPGNSNVLQVLPGGTVTTGKILVTAQPYLEHKIPSPLPILTNSATVLTGLTTIIRNVGNPVTYNSLNGTYVPSSSCSYAISYSIQWQTASSAPVNLVSYIYVDGSIQYAIQSINGNVSQFNTLSCSATIYIAATSSFVIVAQQTSGNTLNITSCNVIVSQIL